MIGIIVINVSLFAVIYKIRKMLDCVKDCAGNNSCKFLYTRYTYGQSRQG